MVAGLNPFLFLKHGFHILHFPNSTKLFTKPTGCHYIEYQFSLDIAITMFCETNKFMHNIRLYEREEYLYNISSPTTFCYEYE